MKYKGYTARAEFDEDAGVFHGEVLDLRDVITFQGRSVADLKKAFRDSINDYLAFCEERGEAPDKPFSGRLMLRLEPGLHRDVYVRAKREGKSLNQWISERLADFS